MTKRILIADDEENLLVLVRSTLAAARYDVHEAMDGAAALSLAYRIRPDLLILDWMMPEMTGIEVVARLREDPLLARTPIILLTARSLEKDRQAGERLNVDAYLTKPFSPSNLLQLVSATLQSEVSSETP